MPLQRIQPSHALNSLCQALSSIRGRQLRKLCKALLAGQVEPIFVDVVPAAEGAGPGVAHKRENCRPGTGAGQAMGTQVVGVGPAQSKGGLMRFACVYEARGVQAGDRARGQAIEGQNKGGARIAGGGPCQKADEGHAGWPACMQASRHAGKHTTGTTDSTARQTPSTSQRWDHIPVYSLYSLASLAGSLTNSRHTCLPRHLLAQPSGFMLQ